LRVARKDAVKLESLVNERTISLQKAKEDDSFDEENKEIINRIGETGDRQKELITQLLNYSRYEGRDFNIEKSHVNIIHVRYRILPNFIQIAANKNQEIHFTYENNEIIILTDSTLFSRIIENILSNAIKYSLKNKNISISIQSLNGKARIKIKDEEPGFKEDEKEIMYKPFVKLWAKPTDGESSTGLGLSIVKRFVELNGGSIELNSTYGLGSEFILEFDEVKA